jgi:AsmA protein
MKTGLKWGLIAIGGTIVLVILILLILPVFVDANKFKPVLEKKVTEMTGRPFSVGGNVDISFFPFAGVSFSDLHLGNPAGFTEKEFVAIKSFDVRVKLLPLLAREVQVKRFILTDPQIVLIKDKQGRTNWDFSTSKGKKPPTQTDPAPSKSDSAEGLPIRSLTVGDFSIKNGTITWIDNTSGTRKTIDKVDVVFTDLSFDRPIGVALSARLDDKPVSLNGTLGPVGQDPGKATIPLDMNLKALSELSLSLKGTVASPAANPRADLTIDVADFSPRKLLAALGQNQAIATKDPGVLNKVSFQAGITATSDRINVTKGDMIVDDTKLTFTARISQFARPDIAFQAEIDSINIDRYLPPASESKPAASPVPPGSKPASSVGSGKKTDYEPLRRMIIDGKLKAGEVIVQKTKLSNLIVTIAGKNGILRIAPLQTDLYQGNLTLNADLNVSQAVPRSAIKVQLKNIQAGPLLKDQMQKDILEGVTNGAIDISFRGDDPELIRQTLTGGGELRFNDGAIKGVDLAGMIRSAKAMLSGQAQSIEVGSRTDFTEMMIPFSISDGIFNTAQTILQSPLLRLKAAGNANLVSETLDFRIESKAVGTIKGQGDQEDRRGVMVPILVSGTFAEPKFGLDTKAIAEEQIEKQVFENKRVKEFIEKKGLKEYEDTAKGVLKKFLN